MFSLSGWVNSIAAAIQNPLKEAPTHFITMPAIIDHAQRRREVCSIAARLIARSGVEGVTIREVAKEAGWSTNRVVHYFKSKHDMLLVTFREFSQRSLDQGEEALRSSLSLQASLEALLPLDDERRLSWQVWLAFWGLTASDPQFLGEQITRGRQIRALIERLLIARLGDHQKGLDWAFESERILTLIVGIATQGVFDPDQWSAEKQRQHLAFELQTFTELRRDYGPGKHLPL